MTVSVRRTWRAAPLTLVVVWVFTVAATVGLPLLAYAIHLRRDQSWLPGMLCLVAGLAVLYAWRFGSHPRLVATDDALVVVNPGRTASFGWSELTLVVPGQNGLVIGSEDAQVEAWCVQKSNAADRRGQDTRADHVTEEVLDLLDELDPLVRDLSTRDRRAGLRLRRARPSESRVLTRIERLASKAALGHIFDPAEFGYPSAAVAQRWHRLLRDRSTRVRVLEVHDEPVGFVAFTADTIKHLAVVPQHSRRGLGSLLLRHATEEMFESRGPGIRLWVLGDNEVARRFYAERGWRATGEQRDCEFPPHPVEIELARPNPAAPRRVLAEQRAT